jgi:hypothetical protein
MQTCINDLKVKKILRVPLYTPKFMAPNRGKKLFILVMTTVAKMKNI